VELWISNDSNASDLTKYSLLKTLLPSAGSAFTPNSTVTYTVTGLPAATYYFRYRVITATGSRSNYSPASTAFSWLPTFPGASTIAIDYNPDFYALSVPFGNTTATGQSLPIVLSVLNGTSLTLYSPSPNDAGMANDTWRVVGISKNNVVLTSDTPTTNATSATWTLTGATQTGSSPATLAASIRYKRNSSNYTDLTQTFNVNLIQAGATGPQGNVGNTGPAGAAASSIDISGITTFAQNAGGAYTPATANLVAITNNITSPTYQWAITGATPTTSTDSSVIITPNPTATSVTANLTVGGSNMANSLSRQTTLAIVQNGATGQAGSNGLMSAFPIIYQWTNSATAPNRPGTSGTYTWSTGTWTVEAGPWSATQPSNTSAGFYLWTITVPLTVAANTVQSSVDWTNSANPVRSIAYNGVNGAQGAQGAQGATGANGTNGTDGTNGTNGTNGSAGSATFIVTRTANDGSAPTNTEVTNAIGRNPVAGDIVTVSFNNANNATVYRYTTSWVTQSTYLTGSLIVEGTITGDRIRANTTITTNLQSTNYVAGTSGFRIEGATGSAEFRGNVTIGSNLNVAGLITTGSLNANTISTNNMNLNSATVAVSAYTAALVRNTVTNVWQSAQSVNITTSGQTVFVSTAGLPQVGAIGDDNVAMIFRIVRGSTELLRSGEASMSFSDAPSAGTYTYSLQAITPYNGSVDPSATGPSISNRSVFVMELKR
jgi:hypothetical protein